MKIVDWFKSKMTTQENMTIQQLVDFLNIHGVSKDKLSEATYFACLKILGESLGKLPFKLLRRTDKGGVVKAYEHPLYHVIGRRPNPYMAAAHFWSTIEYNRNHYGNAYVWIRVDESGRCSSLWPLPYESVSIYVDDKGIWGQQNALWYVFTNPKTGVREKISHDSMLHFKGSTSFDGIWGMSVRDVLANMLEGSINAQAMLNKSYVNGFTGKAVLTYTGSLSEELEKVYVEKMGDFLASDAKTIPIPGGTTLTPLNVKLSDNQFLDIKKYSALQIASAFGVKPFHINDYEKSSYASAEAQNLTFYVDTLLYILKQYEEEVADKLLSKDELADGYYTKFNVSVILRADQKTQMESLRTAVGGSIYTPNEARAFLDKPSMPGGDALVANGNVMPLVMAGKQYERRTD